MLRANTKYNEGHSNFATELKISLCEIWFWRASKIS